MKTLIIWNKEDPALPFIKETHSIPDTAVIVCPQQLESTILSDYDRIFLEVSLNWNGASPSHLYGFRILERIRLRQICCPVYLFSDFSESILVNKSEQPFGVVRTPGHAWVAKQQQYFWKEALLPKVESLTENLLLDINHHFFSIQGAISENWHRLKAQVLENWRTALRDCFSQLEKLFDQEEKTSVLKQIEYKLYREMERAEEQQIPLIQVVAQHKISILELLSPEIAQVPGHARVLPWRVLCIDDSPVFLKQMVEELERFGILCITADSGEAAFEILRDDAAGRLQDATGKPLATNTICAVVCDLRFEDPKTKKWHYWQGWDIVDHIYEELPNLVSFFVLTSKKGSLMREIRGNRRAKVSLFAKDDIVEQKVFQYFADRLLEEGNSMYESLCNQPSGRYWHGQYKNKIEIPLAAYYRHHRLSAEYDHKEAWISRCALSFIREAQAVEDDFYPAKTYIYNLGFSTQFKATQREPPGDPAAMENFFIKLIGRRIAIGLFLLGWDKEDIINILRLMQLNKRLKNRDSTLLPSYLAIQHGFEREIANHLLVEERHWILHELHIPLTLPDRLLYEAVTAALGRFQNNLRYTELDDDFMDEEVRIAHQEDLKQYLGKAYEIASQPMIKSFAGKKLLDEIKQLKQRPELRLAIIRNQHLPIFNELKS